jgi:hypothetical protein
MLDTGRRIIWWIRYTLRVRWNRRRMYLPGLKCRLFGHRRELQPGWEEGWDYCGSCGVDWECLKLIEGERFRGRDNRNVTLRDRLQPGPRGESS